MAKVVVVRAAAMEAAERVVVVMVAVETAEAVLVAVEAAEKAEAMVVEVRVAAARAAVMEAAAMVVAMETADLVVATAGHRQSRQRSSGRYASQSYSRRSSCVQHRPARQHACPECCCARCHDRTPPIPRRTRRQTHSPSPLPQAVPTVCTGGYRGPYTLGSHSANSSSEGILLWARR